MANPTEDQFQEMLARTQANMKGGASCNPPTPRGPRDAAPPRALGGATKRPYTGTGRTRGLNKTECRFAQYLGILQAAGEIAEWRAQDWTFRLADDCRYTPDFAVLRRSVIDAPTTGADEAEILEWDLYDVKGRKKKKDGTPTYWAEEDAKIKIKMAARLWPMFNWYITFPLPNGEWESVRMRG